MASPVQIVGGSFQTPTGQPLAKGYMIFELSEDALANGNTAVASKAAITVPLDDSGSIVTSPPYVIWPNDALIPSNTYYKVSVFSEQGQLVWGPNAQQVLSSPSPFNINGWIPGHIDIS